MKIRNALCLLLSLALMLGMALPGTLAASAETVSTENAITEDDTEVQDALSTSLKGENNQDTSPETDGEAIDAVQTPVTEEATETVEADENTENPGNTETAENTENTETAENTENAETAENPENTEMVGTEETSAHIEACVDGCNGENCECFCHQPGFFEKIMDAATLEEFQLIIMEASDVELDALTDEQMNKINEHLNAIEPEPLPPVVIEETNEDTVPSEIIYPTVSFANVAPFGDPVVGGAE